MAAAENTGEWNIWLAWRLDPSLGLSGRRLGTSTVAYPDDGADSGEIFRNFGGALRKRGRSQRGAARSHRALHRDAVGGSTAERRLQRHSRRLVAIVPLAVAMRRPDRPRIGLLFFVPGANETFRVNGRARISVNSDLKRRFTVNGKEPATVMVVTVEEAFHHCPKALVRSNLWKAGSVGRPLGVPTMGEFRGALP